MTRQRWIYVNGEAVPAEEFSPEPKADFHVLPDMQPYKSMCDGSMVMGRRQHREHLRAHGVVEVGNEVKHLKPYGGYRSPDGLKETVVREVQRAKEAQRSGRKYGSN